MLKKLKDIPYRNMLDDMADYYREIIKRLETEYPLHSFYCKHLQRLYLMDEYLRQDGYMLIPTATSEKIKQHLMDKRVKIGEICKTGMLVAERLKAGE